MVVKSALLTTIVFFKFCFKDLQRTYTEGMRRILRDENCSFDYPGGWGEDEEEEEEDNEEEEVCFGYVLGLFWLCIRSVLAMY